MDQNIYQCVREAFRCDESGRAGEGRSGQPAGRARRTPLRRLTPGTASPPSRWSAAPSDSRTQTSSSGTEQRRRSGGRTGSRDVLLMSSGTDLLPPWPSG